MRDHRVLLCCRRSIAAILIAIGLLAVGGPAAAQSQDKPSPEQLWDAYPLEPGSEKAERPDPAPTATQTPSATASATPTSAPTVTAATTEDDAGGGLSAPVFIAGGVVAFGVGIGAGALLLRRRRDEGAPVVAPASARPAAEAVGRGPDERVEAGEELVAADETVETGEELVAADETVETGEELVAADETVETGEELVAADETVETGEELAAADGTVEAEGAAVPVGERSSRRGPWAAGLGAAWPAGSGGAGSARCDGSAGGVGRTLVGPSERAAGALGPAGGGSRARAGTRARARA